MGKLKTSVCFITITCLYWTPILSNDSYKEIVISSLKFLIRSKRITLYGFVLMPDHMHLLWKVNPDIEEADLQRDFLKFTAQQILKDLRNNDQLKLESLFVGDCDRKYQVWERNSLSVPIWSDHVLWQKLNYIHRNPVAAQLCDNPGAYKYSSFNYYQCRKAEWDFLTHVKVLLK
jgi:putative transposase